VQPVLLGSGKRLFKDLPQRRVLRLSDVQTLPSGVVLLKYLTNYRRKPESGTAYLCKNNIYGY
jgi:hypothetical protein